MNKEFWKAAAIRALHTVAQAALGVIGAATVIDEVNWQVVLSTALLAGVVSLLKSCVVGVPEVPGSSTVDSMGGGE